MSENSFDQTVDNELVEVIEKAKRLNPEAALKEWMEEND